MRTEERARVERGIAVPTEGVLEALSGHVSPLKGWLESRRSTRYLGMPGGLGLVGVPVIRPLLLVEVRRVERLRPRPVDVVMERHVYAVDPVELADWDDEAHALFARLQERHEALLSDIEGSRLLAAAEAARIALIERILDLGSEVIPQRSQLLDAASVRPVLAPPGDIIFFEHRISEHVVMHDALRPDHDLAIA